jgi:hypothetical protein
MSLYYHYMESYMGQVSILLKLTENRFREEKGWGIWEEETFGDESS